eukprot:scaffold209_cov85-Alexandrium_tamarense.AAC.1
MADAAGAEWAGPAEPNDGAEARHHLLLGIITCGLPQPMAERFIDEQGIASARELSMLSDEEVKHPNEPGSRTQAWHRTCQEDKGPQGKEFVSDDWTRETVTSTIATMAAEVGEADAKGFNAGPIKD